MTENINLMKLNNLGDVARLDKHNQDRENNRNKEIKKEASQYNQNIELINPEEYTAKRLAEYEAKGKKLRADTNQFIGLVSTFNKDNWTPEQLNKWVKGEIDFLKKTMPNNELLTYSIHLDETQPHIHILASAYNKEAKKFNSKWITKDWLTNWKEAHLQDLRAQGFEVADREKQRKPEEHSPNIWGYKAKKQAQDKSKKKQAQGNSQPISQSKSKAKTKDKGLTR